MPRADILPVETDEERGGYALVDGGDVYVGDRVRVREMIKKKGSSGGLMLNKRVNGRVVKVRFRDVRTTIADVHRVARSEKDGHVYVTGVIVSSECEGEFPPGNDRFRYRVGSPAFSDGSKEIAILPGTGPDESIRDTMQPTTHSTKVRLEKWRSLLDRAEDAGVGRKFIEGALFDAGDSAVTHAIERRNATARAAGKEEMPIPDDLGSREAAAARAALAGEQEPEFWMWKIVAEAAEDPEGFKAQWDWEAAFA